MGTRREGAYPKCPRCKRKDYPIVLDHIVPRSRGGSDLSFNRQELCLSCNSRKNNEIEPGVHYSLFDRPLKIIPRGNLRKCRRCDKPITIAFRRKVFRYWIARSGSGRMPAFCPRHYWNALTARDRGEWSGESDVSA